jgi:hypothetical protein
MKFFSRSGLDQLLFENFFRGKRAGVFVDAGAADSDEASSSTLFFKRFMDWRGLRVEAPETVAAALQKHSLLQVDYCSIHAPGSELALLSGIDFARSNISLISIRTRDADGKLTQALTGHGYELFGTLEHELLFKRADFKRLARTSVICAVWHGDANRHRLLEGHAENLSRQTVPIEPIYIFDGCDEPPASLPGRKVVVHEKMSIYQAWNVGLAMVGTPFVMNLNLDDRLATDAVEHLENASIREGAALVGGDWKICYSQQETDNVSRCFPAAELPFATQWPPPPGTRTRLGSGTGERGTLGPATLWRMDAHVGAPRYPWRFPDGTIVKVIGDMCWWTLVTQMLQKKAVRLADVIGHYHSHPGEQAEFRGPSNETALMNALGLSLL